ncbi:MAG: antibiotic biosynthesis monooxygenase [Rhizobiaceae bacterium]|nr:antibiotic biosynthesis monooxygenase [Rhizobiaceae bacterium]
MIYVIATLEIRPGSRDAVVAAATPCLFGTRDEDGCLRYDLLVDVLDETRLTFVEVWESREALQAHFSAPHLVAWRAARAPYVVSARVEIVHSDKVETL